VKPSRKLFGNEWIQLAYLNKKTPNDFIPGGTTQNQFKATVVKRFGSDLELNAWVQYEGWKAPIYKPGLQKIRQQAFSSLGSQASPYPTVTLKL
jgi:hypothetical protein